MTRFLLLLLGATLLASAQIKLYVVTDIATGAEREITSASSFDLGSAGPDDTLQTRFRLRNTGTTTQQVQTLRIAGQGFTLSIPSLPFPLAPNGLPLDFSVRFSGSGSGSYSANLTAGTISILLRATVLSAASLVTEIAGARVTVASGTPVSIGSVQRGQKVSRSFWLENRNSDTVTIRSMQITGPFSLRPAAASSLPVELRPNAAYAFDVEFAPNANQQFTGTLVVDGRAFTVTGIGFDPPLSKPSIEIDGLPASGQQPTLTIRLEKAAEANQTGTLKMEFTPQAGVAAVDDSAIRFVSSPAGGPRNLSVLAREGEAQLFIGGPTLREAVFQTGTTAGEIVFTLEIGPYRQTATLKIAPAAAKIDSSSVLRRTQDLDVSITGFDNTRSLSQAVFTFFDSSGRSLTPAPINADVRREFEQFFSQSNTGGIFTMRATFPVQGPAAQIAGVEVEVVNSAGATRTQRLSFPQ